MFVLLTCALLASGTLRLDESSRVRIDAGNILFLSTTSIPEHLHEDWEDIPVDAYSTLPPSGRLQFGHRTPPTLLRLELEVPRPGRWWLVSELRTPKRIELGLGSRRLGTFGDDAPFRMRPLAVTDLAIPLDLRQPRETLFIAVSEPKGPCNVALHLTPDASLPIEVATKATHDAWVVGYMTAIFLLAFVLWLVVRERAFAWYVLYFACALLWLATKRGLGFQYLWPDFPALNPGASLFLAHLAEGAFTLFLCDILQLSRSHPLQDRLLRVVAMFQFAIAPIQLACLPSGLVLQFVGALQGILPLWLLVVLILRAWRGGDPMARKLLAAFLPLGGAMIYGALVEFGVSAGGPAVKATVLTFGALLENTLATLVLLDEVRRREKARLRLEREFHAKVVEASDELSRELSSDLHDDVGQRIYSLRMKVFSLRDSIPPGAAQSLDERFGDLHQALRGVCKRLHPPILHDLGLEHALHDLCADSEVEGGARVRFQIVGAPPFLSDTVSTHLYRIAQESLSNALRHSKAGEISMTLRFEKTAVTLEIEDDGIGLGRSVRESGGLGLSGIRSRARAMNGRAEIADRIGGGTRVTVRIPLRDEGR